MEEEQVRVCPGVAVEVLTPAVAQRADPAQGLVREGVKGQGENLNKEEFNYVTRV